jgi:hypothetical protein
MRNYEETFSSLKRNVLEKCDADVFIHTYESRGWTLNANRSPSSSGDYIVDGFDKTSPRVDVNAVFDLYNPVKMVVENWTAIEPILKNGCSFVSRDRYSCPSENPINVWSQWRKWYLCLCDVLETKIDYDYIVRYRPDMYIDTPLDLPLDDTIYTPTNFSYGLISDVFAVGKVAPMKKYLSLYNHAENMYNTTVIDWNPHIFLLNYLNMNSVSHKSLDIGIHK